MWITLYIVVGVLIALIGQIAAKVERDVGIAIITLVGSVVWPILLVALLLVKYMEWIESYE